MTTETIMGYQIDVTYDTSERWGGKPLTMWTITIPDWVARTWREAWAEWERVEAARLAADPHEGEMATARFHRRLRSRLHHARLFRLSVERAHRAVAPQGYTYIDGAGLTVMPFD